MVSGPEIESEKAQWIRNSSQKASFTDGLASLHRGHVVQITLMTSFQFCEGLAVWIIVIEIHFPVSFYEETP